RVTVRVDEREAQVADGEVFAKRRGKVTQERAQVSMGSDRLRDRQKDGGALVDRRRNQAARPRIRCDGECGGTRVHGTIFGKRTPSRSPTVIVANPSASPPGGRATASGARRARARRRGRRRAPRPRARTCNRSPSRVKPRPSSDSGGTSREPCS